MESKDSDDKSGVVFTEFWGRICISWSMTSSMTSSSDLDL
ncbi:hypothetical protein PVAP13_4NG029600 [Panicum virgatum]|uniref:Uncharacterized protein n=1 Tax=Panicum virgatum TaxID=38727 RepID=A0A8T0SYG3_PANVG|nr:hypothetical protein PVAP13_4NG029600 [Panicum virgatum]